MAIPQPGTPEWDAWIRELSGVPEPEPPSALRRIWSTVTSPLRALTGATGGISGGLAGLIAPEAYSAARKKLLDYETFGKGAEGASIPESLAALPGLGDVIAEAIPQSFKESAVGRAVTPLAQLGLNIGGDPTTYLSLGASSLTKGGRAISDAAKILRGAEKTADAYKAVEAATDLPSVLKIATEAVSKTKTDPQVYLDAAKAAFDARSKAKEAFDVAVSSHPVVSALSTAARPGAFAEAIRDIPGRPLTGLSRAAAALPLSPIPAVAYAPELLQGIGAGASEAYSQAEQGNIGAAAGSAAGTILQAGLAALVGKGLIDEGTALQTFRNSSAGPGLFKAPKASEMSTTPYAAEEAQVTGTPLRPEEAVPEGVTPEMGMAVPQAKPQTFKVYIKGVDEGIPIKAVSEQEAAQQVAATGREVAEVVSPLEDRLRTVEAKQAAKTKPVVEVPVTPEVVKEAAEQAAPAQPVEQRDIRELYSPESTATPEETAIFHEAVQKELAQRASPELEDIVTKRLKTFTVKGGVAPEDYATVANRFVNSYVKRAEREAARKVAPEVAELAVTKEAGVTRQAPATKEAVTPKVEEERATAEQVRTARGKLIADYSDAEASYGIERAGTVSEEKISPFLRDRGYTDQQIKTIADDISQRPALKGKNPFTQIRDGLRLADVMHLYEDEASALKGHAARDAFYGQKIAEKYGGDPLKVRRVANLKTVLDILHIRPDQGEALGRNVEAIRAESIKKRDQIVSALREHAKVPLTKERAAETIQWAVDLTDLAAQGHGLRHLDPYRKQVAALLGTPVNNKAGAEDLARLLVESPLGEAAGVKGTTVGKLEKAQQAEGWKTFGGVKMPYEVVNNIPLLVMPSKIIPDDMLKAILRLAEDTKPRVFDLGQVSHKIYAKVAPEIERLVKEGKLKAVPQTETFYNLPPGLAAAFDATPEEVDAILTQALSHMGQRRVAEAKALFTSEDPRDVAALVKVYQDALEDGPLFLSGRRVANPNNLVTREVASLFADMKELDVANAEAVKILGALAEHTPDYAGVTVSPFDSGVNLRAGRKNQILVNPQEAFSLAEQQVARYGRRTVEEQAARNQIVTMAHEIAHNADASHGPLFEKTYYKTLRGLVSNPETMQRLVAEQAAAFTASKTALEYMTPYFEDLHGRSPVANEGVARGAASEPTLSGAQTEGYTGGPAGGGEGRARAPGNLLGGDGPGGGYGGRGAGLQPGVEGVVGAPTEASRGLESGVGGGVEGGPPTVSRMSQRSLPQGRTPEGRFETTEKDWKKFETSLKRAVKPEHVKQVPELLSMAKKAYNSRDTHDVQALQELMDKVEVEPSKLNRLLTVYKAGLLGYPSRISSAAANTLMQGFNDVEHTVAGALDTVRSALTGKERTIFKEEIPLRLHAYKEALVEAWPDLLRREKDALLLRPADVDLSKLSVEDLRSGKAPFKGKLGELFTYQFKGLDTEDAFFRTFTRNKELYTLSLRAVRNGELKIKPNKTLLQSVQDYVQEIKGLKDSADSLAKDDPRLRIARQADERAKRSTLQADLGEFGKSMQAFLRKHPALQFIVPFFRTPSNAIKEAFLRTPFGFVDAFRRYQKGVFGEKGSPAAVAAFQEELSKPLVASAVGAGLFGLALGGDITGAGSPDPNVLETLKASGWQPYSIRIGNQYISYQRLQPFSSILGMFADAAEGYKQGEFRTAQGSIKRAVGSIAENFTNQTFLSGLNGFVTALSDPLHYLGTFTKQLEGSLVPATIGPIPFAHLTRGLDPTFRQTEPYTVEPVAARLPGVSETLTPQYTPTGEERQRPGSTLERIISPLTRSVVQNPSDLAVAQELARIGWAPQRPRSTYNLDGYPVRLKDEEVKSLAEANAAAMEEVAEVIKGKHYQALPDNDLVGTPGEQTKAEVLSAIVRKHRSKALARLKPELLARAKSASKGERA